MAVFPPWRFVPSDSGSHPEGLPPARGVAASAFRPLRNIPHCCLPWESGPCLSPNVAGHPLRPATRHSLGEPSPHQLADRPRAPPCTVAFMKRPPFPAIPCETTDHAVLARVSPGYPPHRDRLLTCYSPVRRSARAVQAPPVLARLACVKHAASVRPEPGSNSPKRKVQNSSNKHQQKGVRKFT